MSDQDDRGGLSEADDRLLEFWLRFAALSPEQQHRFWERVDADREYRAEQRRFAEWAKRRREYRAGMS